MKERRPDEGQPYQGRPQDARADIAQIHRQLRSQRVRRELGKGQAFLVISLGDPLAALNEIALHISHQRYKQLPAGSHRPIRADGCHK